MNPTRIKTRNQLRDQQKFQIAQVLDKPGLEFANWQAAVDYVKEQTGIEVTPSNLRGLRSNAELNFRVLLSETNRIPKSIRSQIRDLQDRVEKLEEAWKSMGGTI